MRPLTLGIRTKLIAIFIFIKVLPLVLLVWLAWEEISHLGQTIESKYVSMTSDTKDVVKGVTGLSTENSISALDQKSRESIERLTTDTARAVASFLYGCDKDIQMASQLSMNDADYRRFLSGRRRPVVSHGPWVMDDAGADWVPLAAGDASVSHDVKANNDDNRRDFNYRPPEKMGIVENRPTYLEMTFVDLEGHEKLKVTTSNVLPNELFDISDTQNTYCRAETYFQALKALKPGEIFVSEVIGPYVKSDLIGKYTTRRTKKLNIPFEPQKSGYAGKENPVGVRFQGLVRWAIPVLRKNEIIGYVTLALDHTHIMEFTDHIIPTEERYSPISDAASGNYAFMWDYLGRNISHPRDYFIVGYDPETGEQAVPWLDEEMYQFWLESNRSMKQFQERAPLFNAQSLSKKPAKPLTDTGFVGLDGRYLNFAPQCTGWHNLTQFGGSGSFLIFWSGLWKLTTAAAIPYYTGIYGKHPRGFGYVTIGANVDEFHRSAVETATRIYEIESQYNDKLEDKKQANQKLIKQTVQKAFKDLSFYTSLMIVVVIGVAVVIAAALTTRITSIIQGIKKFQGGDHSCRLKKVTNDEMGQLSDAFNEMADTVEHYIGDIELSQIELAKHRDNLEDLVKDRTFELEKEIVERMRVEKLQNESEARLRIQHNTLLRLAGDETLHQGDLKSALKIVMEEAGKTLHVERSSVWLFDNRRQKGRCHEMYLLGSNRHTRGGKVWIADYVSYVEALNSSRTIAASDAMSDERLVELQKEYLPAIGIQSILVATILSDAQLIGSVNFEQLDSKRQWHIDEQNFAHSIADIVALAIGAAKRKKDLKEKHQLEVRLQRIEKMEAIGTLAGGVAHDLNNILSGLISYPELLLLQMEESDPLRKPVETILSSGKRAAVIVQDLLNLAKKGVAPTEIINLNDIITEYLESPEHGKVMNVHPQISITKDLKPDLMNIRGSAVHITKTIMNLVMNAAEAVDGSGEITISSANSYIDRPFKGYDMVTEGDYAAVTIADTGIGISAEDSDHIFEPFYTRKKMGRSGTGLGMAVVWGVVKDHNGYIDFESREGEGSRFTLYFPVTRQVKSQQLSLSMDDYRGHGESILVVDDIEEQRRIATAILSELGYQVMTKCSGEEAVDYLKDKRVDLLILDMIMDPGIDGLDTYKEILKIHPEQKAIIASGFSETERIKESMRIGVSHHVKKPYTIENIGLTVHAVLSD